MDFSLKNPSIAENLLPADSSRNIDRCYVWHPWSPLDVDRSQLMLSHGKGYKVWDIDGKEYIDGSSLNLTCGYTHQEVITSIVNQLAKIHGTDISLASHEPVGKLAKRLTEFLPKGLSKHLFVNSGSEGIEAAIFIAASYWIHLGQARSRIITFSSGYHGSTLLSRSITKLPRVSHPIKTSIVVDSVDLTLLGKNLKKTESLDLLIECFEKKLRSENDLPIAVLIEPFLNVGGAFVLPKGFLSRLRKLCDKANTLLIIDEVFTGYARTGKMFAFQHDSMAPDILVSSKGLAAGYMPIAAVSVLDKIHKTFIKDEAISGLRYGHTTSGHAVACAAALSTLDIIEKEKLCKKAKEYGELLVERFLPFIDKNNVEDVRGFGLILVIELKSLEIAAKIKEKAQDKGLLLRQCGKSLMFVPPLIIDQRGIDDASEIISEMLKK